MILSFLEGISCAKFNLNPSIPGEVRVQTNKILTKFARWTCILPILRLYQTINTEHKIFVADIKYSLKIVVKLLY